MKHRDHYSHSVYVFALGLAIYESNATYRSKFKSFYGFDTDTANKDEDRRAACCFLECWGLASLFHDIGYPFELPFEQVLSYFEVGGASRGEGSLYIAYHDLDALTQYSGTGSPKLPSGFLNAKNPTSITSIGFFLFCHLPAVPFLPD